MKIASVVWLRTRQGALQNYKSENVSARKGNEVREKIESRMASYGNGARGVVSVQWKKGGGTFLTLSKQEAGFYTWMCRATENMTHES